MLGNSLEELKQFYFLTFSDLILVLRFQCFILLLLDPKVPTFQLIDHLWINLLNFLLPTFQRGTYYCQHFYHFFPI